MHRKKVVKNHNKYGNTAEVFKYIGLKCMWYTRTCKCPQYGTGWKLRNIVNSCMKCSYPGMNGAKVHLISTIAEPV